MAMRLRPEGEVGTLELGGVDEAGWRGELVSVGVDGEDAGAWVVGGVRFGVGEEGFEGVMNVGEFSISFSLSLSLLFLAFFILLLLPPFLFNSTSFHVDPSHRPGYLDMPFPITLLPSSIPPLTLTNQSN